MYTALLSASVLALVGVAQATTPVTTPLSANSDFSMTKSLLTTANYTSTLSAMTGVTFLTPTNEAWTKFFATTNGQNYFNTNGTSKNNTNLANLFKYHVVSGTVTEAPSDGGQIFWNTAYTNSSFSGAQKLVALRNSSGFTYYSADSRGSRSTTGTTAWTGGLVMGIDTVLLPPYLPTRTATDLNLIAYAGALDTAGLNNVVDTQKNANGSTGFTYFAPSNQAFADIADTISSYSTSQLSSVLNYHMMKNRMAIAPCAPYELTTVFSSGTQYKSLDSNITFTFKSTSEGDFVNGAKVIAKNIPVRNGLLHIIDQVINPASISASPSGSAGIPAFTGAVTQTTEVPFTTSLAIAQSTTVTPVTGGAYAAKTAMPVLAAAAGVFALVL